MKNDPLQKQYYILQSTILKLSGQLNRHDGIRLKNWLQKLSLPMTNPVWKQNRNLYMKVLLQMVIEGELTSPFNVHPHEGPLKKITVYDVPFPIRMKLNIMDQNTNTRNTTPSQNKYKDSAVHTRKNSLNGISVNNYNYSSKSNNSINNYYSNNNRNQNQTLRSLSKEIKNSSNANSKQMSRQVSKKIIFDEDKFQSLFKDKHNQYQNQSLDKLKNKSKNKNNSNQNKIFSISELKKDIADTQNCNQNIYDKNSTSKFKMNNYAEQIQNNYETHRPDDKDKIKKQGFQILKKTLKFLGRHYDQFSDSIRYKQLIQKIVDTGDKLGQNMRQVSIPSTQQSILVDRYNQQIKNKFYQTDLNCMQFMNYLNSLA